MSEALPFQIDVDELAALRRGAAAHRILDVREPWEVELCALPESLHIPMGLLPGRLAELPRDALIIVLCHHGVRSAQATQWLRAQGFERTVNLAGGIDAWARVIDRSMDVY